VIRFHPRQLARIYAHAWRAHPEECCGLLLGSADRVEAVVPVANAAARDREHRYLIAPRKWLRVDRIAAARGWEILGYYHSHPGGGPAPSAVDAALAWPGYVYLIVGYGPPDRWVSAAWRLDPDTGRWVREAMEEEAAA